MCNNHLEFDCEVSLGFRGRQIHRAVFQVAVPSIASLFFSFLVLPFIMCGGEQVKRGDENHISRSAPLRVVSKTTSLDYF